MFQWYPTIYWNPSVIKPSQTSRFVFIFKTSFPIVIKRLAELTWALSACITLEAKRGERLPREILLLLFRELWKEGKRVHVEFELYSNRGKGRGRGRLKLRRVSKRGRRKRECLLWSCPKLMHNCLTLTLPNLILLNPMALGTKVPNRLPSRFSCNMTQYFNALQPLFFNNNYCELLLFSFFSPKASKGQILSFFFEQV